MSVLAACSSPPPVVSDAEWCGAVEARLHAIGVGWPVANQPLTSEQIDGIERVFVDDQDRAAGDLRVAAVAWIAGFRRAAPYLRLNDERGFEMGVSEETKRKFRLANIAVKNLCQW